MQTGFRSRGLLIAVALAIASTAASAPPAASAESTPSESTFSAGTPPLAVHIDAPAVQPQLTFHLVKVSHDLVTTSLAVDSQRGVASRSRDSVQRSASATAEHSARQRTLASSGAIHRADSLAFLLSHSVRVANYERQTRLVSTVSVNVPPNSMPAARVIGHDAFPLKS